MAFGMPSVATQVGFGGCSGGLVSRGVAYMSYQWQDVSRIVRLALLALLSACAPFSSAAGNEAATVSSAISVQQGWRIVFDQRLGNCAACHSIPDQKGAKAGIQSTFAPALDGVATRYSPAQLRQWVVDARLINPNTLMPPFGQILTPQQVTEVLAALQTLR